MQKTLKSIITLLIAVTSLFILASCANKGGSSSGDAKTLKVAVMPFLNSVPIEYMINNKLDQKYGFTIETVYFPSGGPMNEALGAGLWEVGTLSAASVYSLANYNAHVVADIGHSEGGIEVLVNPDSDILTVKGVNKDFPEVYGDAATLKGKTIAVPTGTISHLNVIHWLRAINVDPNTVNIVHMEFPQAYHDDFQEQNSGKSVLPPFHLYIQLPYQQNSNKIVPADVLQPACRQV